MEPARDHEQLVVNLLQARTAASITALPSQVVANFDVVRGYEIGRALHGQLLERGYQSVGRKIGFTNRDVWEQFQAKAPMWAHTYAQTVHFADRGRCELSLAGMVAPRIESEIVVKLCRSLPHGELTTVELADCLEWVALGFEIVDCHFSGWRFTLADVIADFGVHAALIVGTPWHLKSENPADVAATLQSLKVSLHRGKEIVARGAGRNVLGSPLLSLGELNRVLATQNWAAPLEPGEIITTGTLTPVSPVAGGETWRVEAEGTCLEPLEWTLCE